MPENQYSGGGEDLYSDDGDVAPADDTEPADEMSDEITETALVPKSFCPGMNPGDEGVFRVDEVLDDQYQISYIKEPGGEEPTQATVPEAEDMASMMGA
jgi:hypothetical protein